MSRANALVHSALREPQAYPERSAEVCVTHCGPNDSYGSPRLIAQLRFKNNTAFGSSRPFEPWFHLRFAKHDEGSLMLPTTNNRTFRHTCTSMPEGLDRGFDLQAKAMDASFGTKSLSRNFTGVTLMGLPIQTRADDSEYLLLTIGIRDEAGNATTARAKLNLDEDAPIPPCLRTTRRIRSHQRSMNRYINRPDI